MGEMRAVRRNFSGLERRRMEAARLLRDGVWQAEVARRVGVRPQSVGEWAKKIRRGGMWALKAGRLGRPRKLHQEQLRRVEKQLERGPQMMRRRKWTVWRVGELIERDAECSIARRGIGECCAGWGGGGRAEVRRQRFASLRRAQE
jgi:transposase